MERLRTYEIEARPITRINKDLIVSDKIGGDTETYL